MDNKEIIKQYLVIFNKITILRNQIIETKNQLKGINLVVSEIETKENNNDSYLTFNIEIKEIDILTSEISKLISIFEDKEMLSKTIFKEGKMNILVRTK